MLLSGCRVAVSENTLIDISIIMERFRNATHKAYILSLVSNAKKSLVISKIYVVTRKYVLQSKFALLCNYVYLPWIGAKIIYI